jgi:hypothetical protein
MTAQSSRRSIFIALLLMVLLAFWYLFRPERVFVDKRVAEPPPTGAAR